MCKSDVEIVRLVGRHADKGCQFLDYNTSSTHQVELPESRLGVFGVDVVVILKERRRRLDRHHERVEYDADDNEEVCERVEYNERTRPLNVRPERRALPVAELFLCRLQHLPQAAFAPRPPMQKSERRAFAGASRLPELCGLCTLLRGCRGRRGSRLLQLSLLSQAVHKRAHHADLVDGHLDVVETDVHVVRLPAARVGVRERVVGALERRELRAADRPPRVCTGRAVSLELQAHLRIGSERRRGRRSPALQTA